MSRFISRAAAVRGLAAAPFAALALPRRTFAQTGPPLPVRVIATANDTYAEAYYAQELGLFRKAGLAVDLSTATNGATVAQAVVGGAADIGISNVVQIATAVQKGVPLRYFAGGGLYSTDEPTTALCVARDAAIRTATDFEGKTIAVSTLKDTSFVATESWLVGHGAQMAKIQFIELPFAAMGPALVRGTVAGAVISEPSLSAAQAAGAKIFAKSYDAIATRFMISGWFATIDYAAKNKDVIARYTQVIYDTARWANAHRPESAAILAKAAQLDPKVTQSMARCQYALSLDPKLLQPAIDAAARYGLIDHAIPAVDLTESS